MNNNIFGLEYKKELDNVCKHLIKPIKLVALQELVELATAMKVKNLTTDKVFGLGLAYCPKCNQVVQEEFCGSCGQALDWSE